MKSIKSTSNLPTSVQMETKQRQLDKCRSPSMWEKLEKWKTEKKAKLTGVKATARQPFKVGVSKVQKGKVPSKASEKMKLLAESNRKTTWSYNTSPRHLNYRKSMSSVRKSKTGDRKTQEQVKENLETVRQTSNRNIRRETLTVSVGRKNSGRISQQISSGKARRETLTLVENSVSKQEDKKRKLEEDDEEEVQLRKSLKVDVKSTSNGGGLKQKEIRTEMSTCNEEIWHTGSGTKKTWASCTSRKAISHHRAPKSKRSFKANTQERKSGALLDGNQRNLDTTSQEEQTMREKLEQWLIAKGKTPRRAARIVKTPKVTSKQMKRNKKEDVLCNDVLTVKESMDVCKHILNEGCPPEYISDWLESIQGKLPCLGEMEAFLDCQSVVLEAVRDGSTADKLERTIQSDSYQSGLEGGYEPEETNEQVPVTTPSRRKSRRSSFQLLSPVGELEESSAVKYQVREATPYFKRIQDALGKTSDTPSTMIITPVRRSIRLSKRKSVSFANHSAENVDMCVDKLEDLDGLPLIQPVQLILRSNRALEEEFSLAEEGTSST